MDSEVEQKVSEILPSLIVAVETIMNPIAPPTERLAAHKVCEEFKETSTLCIPCGLVLAQKTYSHIIRHFGLQLLEHSIRFKWLQLDDGDKDLLKRSALELIANGTVGIIEEKVHIKDGIARITVEIVKREWPQLWTSLLKDLYDLCQLGETQTEIVLKIFLRLIEDVITFQNVPQQRRREVIQGLTSHMGELFEFFMNLLQHHTTTANNLAASTSPESVAACKSHMFVSEAVLTTLTGYLDWVSMNQIFVKDGLLLQMLCLLLDNRSLQLPAVECLLIIVSKRGKVEDRQPLLILFSEDAMSVIWNAIVAAEQVSLDDYFYLFLKRLCQVLIELGKQLCALWGIIPDVGRPPNFSKYLESLLAFTQHPSQMISSYTQTLWALFLRNKVISKDPELLLFIPRLFQSATKTLVKVGFPTQNNSPSCDYARLDFDSDEEFNMFFSKYRAEVADTLRLGTVLQPVQCFMFARDWLQSTLQKPVNIGNGAENGNCTLASPSFLEWDAMTVCLECVMTRAMQASEEKPNIEEGITLLNNVLNFQTEDPLILSSLLSCLSALFPFLNHSPATLPTVIEKIFSAVTFNILGQTKSTRSRAVKNARQHACSILVKICKQYQELLFPVFDKLYSHIKMISSNVEQLSQMEKSILIEALIIVSNRFYDFEKQSKFIEEIIQPVKELWLSDEFRIAFSAPDKLMAYIGLDQAPVEPSSADTCGINRSHISYCMTIILGVIKRCKWPDDLQVAAKGGFILGDINSTTYMHRNPATAHISALLQNLLLFMKSMNGVWEPSYLKLRHPDFAKSYELVDNEKQTILGIPYPCVDNSSSPTSTNPLDRMKNFLTTTHDNSCHVLGNAGQCLGYEFYSAPNLAQSILDTVLTNLEHLPDYRIKPLIRVFIKPFILSCPNECYKSAVIPVLAHLCPFMYERLSSKWQIINQRTNAEIDDLETQEILEEQLTRLLTREYIDFIASICRSKRLDSSGVNTEDEMIDDNEVTTSTPQIKDDSLGDLGQLCMREEPVYPCMVMCIFSGLSWNDTQASNRCGIVGWMMLKQLVADKKMTSDSAVHFLCCVLFGLQLHGEHEASQASLLSLGLQTYELLRPLFPEVSKVLLQIPNCTPELVKSFDDKILPNSPNKQLTDKKKKDAFKKLVVGIIGQNIGQKFKREVSYKNLPPIYRIKPKVNSVDEVETKDLGLCGLFQPSNGASNMS